MQSPFTHNTVYRQYVYLLKDACSQISMELKWEDNKQPECDTRGIVTHNPSEVS